MEGEGTSVAHLSYLGDAEVGRHVNIGCGFVTCNFDGRVINGERKHKTIIEDHAFIGSDCQVVAPVRIGRGAYVASGSTITEDVEPESLAIARSRQVNKPGYAKKLRPEAGNGVS
jgi:bifunctional UDP-N-acetylglucosamine pyrophosphorylase/glucosamine-1-phosphate N-acetyltransferase